MRKVVFYMMAAALLSGCNARNGNIMQIEEQGSFAVGGTVLTDSLGRTYHGDHAYVFYQKPVDARKYPLVFAHGVGQFSKTWETTPDGREGFQNIFLRRGFQTYLVDQPRRGNAGRSTTPATVTPVFDEETWFNRFRVGIWPDYFEGVQFSRDKEALNQYFRQMTPTLGPPDLDVYAKAYAALFDRIGPAVFVTHSQGGGVGWLTLPQTRNIRAIVAYEPGTNVPFPERADAGGRESTNPVEEDRRRGSADGRISAVHENPYHHLLWRQSAGNRRTAGTVRMDTTPASDAQMGCLAQRTRRRCHGHSSAGDRFEGQHPFSLLRFEQRGGGRSPVEMVT